MLLKKLKERDQMEWVQQMNNIDNVVKRNYFKKNLFVIKKLRTRKSFFYGDVKKHFYNK